MARTKRKRSNPNPETLGGRIRYAYEYSGETQQSIADKLDISKRQLIRWKDDEVIPSEAMIDRLCEETGFRGEWIRTGEGSRRESLRFSETRIYHRLGDDEVQVLLKPDGIFVSSDGGITTGLSEGKLVLRAG